MKPTTAYSSSVCCLLALVVLSAASLRAGALDPDAARVAENRRRWLSLTEEQRQAIREAAKGVTPDEVAELRKRLNTFNRLPGEEQTRVRGNYGRFRGMPLGQRRKMMRRFEAFQGFPVEKRDELRRRFGRGPRPLGDGPGPRRPELRQGAGPFGLGKERPADAVAPKARPRGFGKGTGRDTAPPGATVEPKAPPEQDDAKTPAARDGRDPTVAPKQRTVKERPELPRKQKERPDALDRRPNGQGKGPRRSGPGVGDDGKAKVNGSRNRRTELIGPMRQPDFTLSALLAPLRLGSARGRSRGERSGRGRP